ncbi:MAG: hypothetical protein UY70_C0016G0004 [Candidatus Kaiserbacteria bacterium GW2011_GWB1_52_6]|uniref:Hint domain-containing protein n=1 Tax=Candidatus Kaiserbacteria bacterium GW2011_GWB1_52_6 TaxID=1618674 RepID=A0A0G1X921_9BACT|nr:MAG: hypothetical protein UY70_C0016G0004 [Candidatus Kaiserbacteria bacterium GW2011_GWB1_52_6]
MPSNESKVKGGLAWARIRSIEPVAEEEVFDVEIEGTHNFVANGIVAHNTYMTGGLGVGVVNTTGNSLKVQGADQLAATKSVIITDSLATELLTVFNNGLTQLKNLLVTASSTIGDGTQAGGLTISGGATTTGNAYFAGTLNLAAAGYFNWGTTLGTDGYGLRDNGGKIEVKNSGGSWKPVMATSTQYARVSGGNTSTDTTVWTVMDISAEGLDPSNISEQSDNKITPTEAGFYVVSVSVRPTGTIADGTRVGAAVYVNGSEIALNAINLALANTDEDTATVSTVFYVDGNDYIEARGYQNSGGTLNLVLRNFSVGKIGGSDYAEYVMPETGTSPSDYLPGELLCLKASAKDTYGHCDGANDRNVVGVVSTNPGIVGNSAGSLQERDNFIESMMLPLAMVGRVPVRVSLENGPIAAGDRITSSSVAGVGMKAGPFDPSVGRAVGNFTGDPAEGGIVEMYIDVQSGLDLMSLGGGLLGSSGDWTEASSSAPFDFVGDLLSAIQSRISSAFSGSALTGDVNSTPATSGLDAVRAFNLAYNPAMMEIVSPSSASSSLSTLTLQASSTQSALLDYLSIVPSLAKGIGELDSRLSDIEKLLPATSTINEIAALAGDNSTIHASTSSTSEGPEKSIVANWAFSSTTNTISINHGLAIPSLTFGDGSSLGSVSDLARLSDLDIATSTMFDLVDRTFATKEDVSVLASTTATLGLRVDSIEEAMFDLRGRTFSVAPLAATTSAAELIPASTTLTAEQASSTPWVASFANASQALRDGISAIADTVIHVFRDAIYATTGIFQKVLTKELIAQNVYADQVTTKKLCVQDDSGAETCVTKVQLDAMIAGQTASAATVSSGGGTGGSGTGGVSSTGGDSSSSASSTTTSTGGDTSGTASSSAPIISINGNNPAAVTVGDTYADLGATITGPVADLNLGIHTFVDGVSMEPVQIDTSAAATHMIDYVATNSIGLTATSTRMMNIIALTPPASTPAPASDPTISTSTATSTTP